MSAPRAAEGATAPARTRLDDYTAWARSREHTLRTAYSLRERLDRMGCDDRLAAEALIERALTGLGMDVPEFRVHCTRMLREDLAAARERVDDLLAILAPTGLVEALTSTSAAMRRAVPLLLDYSGKGKEDVHALAGFALWQFDELARVVDDLAGEVRKAERQVRS